MDEVGKVCVNGKWLNLSDTPINSELQLSFKINKPKDMELLKYLAQFALPPFDYINISDISKAAEEVKQFLHRSIGQLRELYLNRNSDLLDGSEWKEAIVKILPRVKGRVWLNFFSFSKAQVEAIVDNSLHLETLGMNNCKLRKWRFVSLVQID
jgi:hypothetical protein